MSWTDALSGAALGVTFGVLLGAPLLFGPTFGRLGPILLVAYNLRAAHRAWTGPRLRLMAIGMTAFAVLLGVLAIGGTWPRVDPWITPLLLVPLILTLVDRVLHPDRWSAWREASRGAGYLDVLLGRHLAGDWKTESPPSSSSNEGR